MIDPFLSKVPKFTIQRGFPDEHRNLAVSLFWQAFQKKLLPILDNEEKALQFLESVIDPRFAISAISEEGALLGVAGFKTDQGAFIGGELKDLQVIYGVLGGFWRGLVLNLLERPIETDVLLMDGIFVCEKSRGRGVGTALLATIKEEARSQNQKQVRLDVIDRNVRAKTLYEREGFKELSTTHMGPLKYVFGFGKATSMVCEV